MFRAHMLRAGRGGAMNVKAGLTEHDDRWLLPYRDERVIQVRVSYQLTLLLESGATIDIESEALLTHGPLRAPGASSLTLVPERQDVAPALVLFRAKVVLRWRSNRARFGSCSTLAIMSTLSRITSSRRGV